MIEIVSNEYVALLKYYIQSSSLHNVLSDLESQDSTWNKGDRMQCAQARVLATTPFLFLFGIRLSVLDIITSIPPLSGLFSELEAPRMW